MSENPLIYAELLSNIRQISVIAALHTPCDASTKVELSPDGLRFILTHGAKTTTLSLPGQVAANSQLQKPLIGSQELSWRLPLASPPPRADDAQSNEAPWSAASLSSDAEFQCRECRAVIVKQESIKTWKDLPSENWAEMMDFWHCHKPDVPHAHGSSAPPVLDKGYGANTKFSARAGTGFVDLTTFLLSDADCAGILVPSPSSPSSTQPQVYEPLTCAACTTYLGHLDAQSCGLRLYKWRLTSPTFTLASPSLSSILSAQLLSIMASQCISRILIMPHPSSHPTPAPSLSPPALHLWIFAPSLRFSTSTSNPSSTPNSTPTSQLVTKIFYTALAPDAANTLLEQGNIEELYLPPEAVQELESALRDSSAVLPPSTRRFREWDVGLLERFEGRGRWVSVGGF